MINRCYSDSNRVMAAVLAMPLKALGGGEPIELEHGMPSEAAMVTGSGVVLAATTCTLNIFEDTVRATAEAMGKDVILARHDRRPKPMSPIFYDVAYWEGGSLNFCHSYFLCISYRGKLWLMPTCRGPFIELTKQGLEFTPAAPFVTAEEHTDGILKAHEFLSCLTWGASL